MCSKFSLSELLFRCFLADAEKVWPGHGSDLLCAFGVIGDAGIVVGIFIGFFIALGASSLLRWLIRLRDARAIRGGGNHAN